MSKELEAQETAKKELLEAVKTEAKQVVDKATEGMPTSKEVEEIKAQLKNIADNETDAAELKKSVDEALLQIKAIQEPRSAEETKSLKSLIEKNSEVLKEIKAGGSKNHNGFEVTYKSGTTVNASDIADRDYLSEIERGITNLPVRNPSIASLFTTQTVGTEYLHYYEQATVTRDAKVVVACATSTSTTAATWVKRIVTLAKVRDMVDVCIDMLEDYDFIESQLTQLIEESIALKIDNDLLLGAAALATDIQSVDSIASEFSATNVLAPFNGATGTGFASPNLEQLVDAMSAQIQIFGQENSFMPDTMVMNFADFVRYRNLRDDNGNKLIHTLGDVVSTIAGLRVITSPIVPSNECYVFDSTKGKILARKGFTFNISKDNRDNIEHELATMVAYQRMQFYVKNIDQDAFMKCTDITAAITAITNV